jgi:ER degradation enhancer, mannosidase alpha-like 1
MVFTTEGHLLPLPSKYLQKPRTYRNPLIRSEKEDCASHQPILNSRYSHPLQLSVSHRTDGEYVRMMTGMKVDPDLAIKTGAWVSSGFCNAPRAEHYMVDLLFANDETPEDKNPGPNKVTLNLEGLEVKNIQGLKFQVTRKMDDLGYFVSRVGPYPISANQKVFISDPIVIAQMLAQDERTDAGNYVNLKFMIPVDDKEFEQSLVVSSKVRLLIARRAPSNFFITRHRPSRLSLDHLTLTG